MEIAHFQSLLKNQNIVLSANFNSNLQMIVNKTGMESEILKMVPQVLGNLEHRHEILKGSVISVYFACLAGEMLTSTELILPGTEEVLLIAAVWSLSNENGAGHE